MATKYWLFLVMNDGFPGLWRIFANKGIAAQHYPPAVFKTEKLNIQRLQQMKRGDRVIAAFRRHRFAGFGTLMSDFTRSGPSLRVRRDDEMFSFRERFDCNWAHLPFELDRPCINCHKLKTKGYKIDLERGRAVKEIDAATFNAIKAELLAAGALRASRASHRAKIEAVSRQSLPIHRRVEAEEGERAMREAVFFRRCAALARQAKRRDKYTCQVCGFKFHEQYGTDGANFIECHHLKAFSEAKSDEPRKTTLKDVTALCANCHRMVHRQRPPISVASLRRKIQFHWADGVWDLRR